MRLFANKVKKPFEACDATLTTLASCACHMGRRNFLTGLGAAAAAMSAPGVAGAQDKAPRRIVDVHAHLTPPEYIQDLSGTGLVLPPSLKWTPANHVEDMDKVAEGCDAIVVATEWDEFKKLDLNRAKKGLTHPILFDGRNLFDPEEMEKLGWIYKSVGR